MLLLLRPPASTDVRLDTDATLAPYRALAAITPSRLTATLAEHTLTCTIDQHFAEVNLNGG